MEILLVLLVGIFGIEILRVLYKIRDGIQDLFGLIGLLNFDDDVDG